MSKKEEVLEMMASFLKIPRESLSDDSGPESVESWDSLKHTMMLMAAEERFGFRLSDDEMIGVTNVSDLVTLVENKANG